MSDEIWNGFVSTVWKPDLNSKHGIAEAVRILGVPVVNQLLENEKKDIEIVEIVEVSEGVKAITFRHRYSFWQKIANWWRR